MKAEQSQQHTAMLHFYREDKVAVLFKDSATLVDSEDIEHTNVHSDETDKQASNRENRQHNQLQRHKLESMPSCRMQRQRDWSKLDVREVEDEQIAGVGVFRQEAFLPGVRWSFGQVSCKQWAITLDNRSVLEHLEGVYFPAQQ